MAKEKNDQKFEEVVVTSSAEFWDFKDRGTFIGYYVEDFFFQGGDSAGNKGGYLFRDMEDELHIIGDFKSVVTFMEEKNYEGKSFKELGYPVKFELLKQTGEGTKQFNHFKISVLVPAS